MGRQRSRLEMNGEAGISGGNEWGGRDLSWNGAERLGMDRGQRWGWGGQDDGSMLLLLLLFVLLLLVLLLPLLFLLWRLLLLLFCFRCLFAFFFWL